MSQIFLDSGFIIALEAADDQHHHTATHYWKTLLKSPPLLVTTTYVIDEIVTFFNRRNCHSKAVETGSNLMNSPSIQLIHIDESLFQRGWNYFKRHTDKQYSLTDCISFEVMTQLDIKIALTFDNHFAQAGFKKEP